MIRFRMIDKALVIPYAMASMVAVAMALPLLYVVVRGTGDAAIWERLWTTRIPFLAVNTLKLAVAVTALSTIVGTLSAWVLSRFDLPGGAVLRRLLALPLGFPPYIAAYAFVSLLGYGGIAREWLLSHGLHGFLPLVPDPYGFWSVVAVMVLSTYPYVYLLALSSFDTQGRSGEEAARTLGRGPFRVFTDIALPMAAPAIIRGAVTTALYVLSDFGAVSMLRYQTFSSAVYLQLVGRYDRNAAAALSLLLALAAIALFALEHAAGKGGKAHQGPGRRTPGGTPGVSGAVRMSAIPLWILFCLGTLLPMGVLAGWAVRSDPSSLAGLLPHAANSLILAVSAATTAVVLSWPMAWISARRRGVSAMVLGQLTKSGYALPGVVVALGMVFTAVSVAPGLLQTLPFLVAAVVIRFIPQSLQASEAAVIAVSDSLEEASRVAGRGLARTMVHVVVPLCGRGILAGWLLVLLSALRELPATLLLRPSGFDTLPVRIWLDASEGLHVPASVPALFLALVSMASLFVVRGKDK